MLSNCRSLLLPALLAAASSGAAPSAAQAGPLLDWLFGHHQPTYVAAFAPAYPAPVTAGYAPAYQVDYLVPQTAAYAPQTSAYAPQTTAYAPQTTAYAPQTTAYAPAATAYAPQTTAYAPQATAYAPAATAYAPSATAYAPPAADYASSSTGFAPAVECAPGAAPSATAGYTAYAPSTVAAPAIPVQPVTSFFGTGNVYPVTPSLSPTTVQTYRPSLMGGLFSRLRGLFHHQAAAPTTYQTQYYRAAVTYYRPVIAADPSTGGQTTSLAPCSSYQLQPQRLPATSPLGHAPATSPTGALPSCPTCAPGSSPSGYGAPSGYGVAPGPSASAPQAAPSSPSDATDLQPPRLRLDTGSSSAVIPGPGTRSSSYDPGFSSGGESAAADQRNHVREPAASSGVRGSSVRPIPAPSSSEKAAPAQRAVPAPLQAQAPPRRAAWGYKTIQWSDRSNQAAVRPAGAEVARPAAQPERDDDSRARRYDDRGWSAGSAR